MTIKSLKGASGDSLLLFFVRIVTYGTTMILTKILSTSLSLREYSTYAGILLVLSLATSFSIMGMEDCVNYFYNNKEKGIDETKRQMYVNTIFMIELVVGLVLAVCLVVFNRPICDYFGNDAMAPLLFIVALRPFLNNALRLYHVLFISSEKAKWVSVLSQFKHM